MSSSSLLPSKYYDKLQVNRLKANDIKSDNISPMSPSYLFSAVFNNATFNRNETGGTLTITRDDTESIIQFSDRPFRQTENIDFDTFVSLFSNSVSTGDNSFEEDPPNGVLTHEEEQRTYIIRLLNSDNDKATFNFELLPGESHNLNTVSGRMSLFVDNSSTIKITKIFWSYDNDYTPSNQYPDSITIGTLKIETNKKYNLKTLINDINNQGKNATISASGINPPENKSYTLSKFSEYNPDKINTFNFYSDNNTPVTTSNKSGELQLGYYVQLDLSKFKGSGLSIEISYE